MTCFNNLIATILLFLSVSAESQINCEQHHEFQAGCERIELVNQYSAQEKVKILPHIPLAPFDTVSPAKVKSDVEDELKLFELDFNNENIALCPKLKSTSPGTYVLEAKKYYHKVKDSMFEINQAFVEEFFCPGKTEASILATEMRRLKRKSGSVEEIDLKDKKLNSILDITNLHKLEEDVSFTPLPLKEQKLKKLAKFKVTMNDKDTSGTYAPSNLLYYQFSRFLKTRVGVPVSIYREIQAQHHLERVSKSGEKWANEFKNRVSKSYRQLYHGWRRLRLAEENPDSYFIGKNSIIKNIYSSGNNENIWGILIKDKGDRYPHRRRKSDTDQTESINGLLPTKSGYDARQVEFIKSKPFLALRGVKDWKSFSDPLEKVQYQFWMQELAEIVILDFIFSQQDRVGNIDYRDYMYYYEDGVMEEKDKFHSSESSHIQINRKRLSKWKKFEEKNNTAQLLGRIRRTFLNDNDAGVRMAYSNFSKKFNMPGLIRHLDHRFLARLIYLNNALKDEESEQYRYLWENFVDPRLITEREFNQIGLNLNMLLYGSKRIQTNLSETCKDITFDLDPERFLKELVESGDPSYLPEMEVKVDCEKLFSGAAEQEYLLK